jgi:hypothetical protein
MKRIASRAGFFLGLLCASWGCIRTIKTKIKFTPQFLAQTYITKFRLNHFTSVGDRTCLMMERSDLLIMRPCEKCIKSHRKEVAREDSTDVSVP